MPVDPRILPVTEEESARLRRAGWGYVVAVVGPLAASAGYVAAHDSVPLAVFAMVLLLCVLGVTVLNGPVPAVLAAGLSFVGLDLFHEPPSGWPQFSLQEVELLVGFVVVAGAAVALVTWGMDLRERQVRAELRWNRLDRVLGAVAAGVTGEQLVPLVARELTDELGLELVRYEPEPRTTCDYHVGRHGGLRHGKDRLTGLHLRFPGEPVRVPVQCRGEDLGQLVLVPAESGPVTEDQLVLAANVGSVLAETMYDQRTDGVGAARPRHGLQRGSS